MLKLLLNAIAFYVVAYLVPGVHIVGWQALIVVALVWGILSMILKPILIVLTLPVNIMTLGLFTLVINGVLFYLTSKIVPGFTVDGLGTAIFASFVLSLVSWFLSTIK